MMGFMAAFQFLLISPALVRREFTPQEMGRATGFFPVVGLLLGVVLAGADLLLGQLFPAPVRSALVLALWVVLTGGLHFDGFLDSCDGLFGGATPERRMEIMRDERVGAYALAGGALLMLVLFSSLSAITEERWAVLLLAPVLGRWGITLTVTAFPYARLAGLGRDIKDHATRWQALMATLWTAAVVAALTWALRTYEPLIALLGAAVAWGVSSAWILRRIPGMTGDTYGAINMLIETAVLLTFAAAQWS